MQPVKIFQSETFKKLQVKIYSLAHSYYFKVVFGLGERWNKMRAAEELRYLSVTGGETATV
jgi:hypothetical protein